MTVYRSVQAQLMGGMAKRSAAMPGQDMPAPASAGLGMPPPFPQFIADGALPYPTALRRAKRIACLRVVRADSDKSP